MRVVETSVREKGKTMGRFRIVLMCCLLISLLAAGCSDNENPQNEFRGQQSPETQAARKQEEVREQQLAQEGARKQRQAAESLGVPVNTTLNLGRGVKMKLTLIPAGKFQMGSPETEDGRKDDEGPQHEVTISKPFYMGACEVTQAQWRVVMGTEPWVGKYLAKSDPNNPASWITWDAATAFCEALSKITGKKVTLPTEAQWEYACRAGSNTVYYFGDDSSRLGDYAWYKRNTYGKMEELLDKDAMYTRPVGQKKPNAFGLYDMHGNVWEWCRDWYDEKFYAKANKVDPENTTKTEYRVLRGSAWFKIPEDCRAAIRFGEFTDSGYDYIGFRVIIPAGSTD